jgi:hypothetical protein
MLKYLSAVYLRKVIQRINTFEMCKDLAEVGNWRLKPGKLQGRLLKLLACVLLPDSSPPSPLSRGEFFCRGKNNIIV